MGIKDSSSNHTGDIDLLWQSNGELVHKQIKQ